MQLSILKKIHKNLQHKMKYQLHAQIPKKTILVVKEL